MNIQLSDHFGYKKLLIFSLSPILMMIFSSIYGMVDGYFVSNFTGKTTFAAVNFIFPVLMILGCGGFIFGAGGSALIGKTLGEKNEKKANGIFSMLVYTSIMLGVVLAVIGIIFMEKIAMLLGAEGEMLRIATIYGRIYTIGLPFAMLQFEFQSFFILAEKPQLGFYCTLASGVMNMVLDGVLVGICKWGVEGAAIASVASQVVGAVIPLVYFGRENKSLLRLIKPAFDMQALLKTMGNGSSEFVSNVSMSVVSILYNSQLMKYAGEDGISAYGVLMYVGFIFIAIFIGYAQGTAPIISYHYGAENTKELRNVFTRSIKILIVFSIIMLLIGELFAKPFAKLFVGYDAGLLTMTKTAFKYYAFAFLFSGISIFASSFFTALNNGVVSAVISFLRTVVFQVGAVLLLPLWFDLNGIWMSMVASEIAAMIISVIFLAAMRKRYRY